MLVTIILFFILYMLDQILKLVAEGLSQTTTVTVIPNFLEFRLEYNTGMAWSFLADNTWVLVVVSAVASIILMWACSKNDWKYNKVGAVALTMALAGCVGNLYDRILTVLDCRNGVVDMIIFEPFDWICEKLHWGTTVFNLADVFLVVGIILFAIDFCFFADRKKKKRKYAELKTKDPVEELEKNTSDDVKEM